MILCWASFIAILGCMWPLGHGLDTPKFSQLIVNVNQTYRILLEQHLDWSLNKQLDTLA